MREEEIGKLNLKSAKELLRTKKDQVQQAKALSREEAKILKERARGLAKASKKSLFRFVRRETQRSPFKQCYTSH